MYITKKKTLLIAILAAVLSLSIAVPAFASFVYGSQVSGSINGITYTGKAMVGASDSSGINEAIGHVNMNASRSVSARTMGADVNLYTSGGELIASQIGYNASSAKYFTLSTGYVSSPTHSYFFASGHMRGKNSAGGYNSIAVPRTPNAAANNLSYDMGPFAIDAYLQNERNMTYGSDLSEEFVGELPDLRLARGTNGEEGYIKLTDYEAVAASEAESPSSENRTVYIPLYEKDGVSQIGEYAIGLGYDESLSGDTV